MFSRKVVCCSGLMVLMVVNPRPTRPSEASSARNDSEISFGRPKPWFRTVAPPMSIVSLPTPPRAKEESPYVMLKVEPSSSWNVLDFAGSKTAWPADTLGSSFVLNTHL